MRILVYALMVSTILSVANADEPHIIFTANQNFLSRIYVLNMDGTVETYHEFSMYRFCDLEVIDGEIYAAEAFAPRVLKVDIETWDLDVIVDDWSLYYFYGLCFDGMFLYVDEWDLNRYYQSGVKEGTASFDEDVMGQAWDGTYMWTLNDTGEIRCWDISAWPTVTEVPEHNFDAPSAACRGLWFDGQYFFTAESIEGTLGHIFQFDADGTVIRQWLEPAFRGWGACILGGRCGDANGDDGITTADGYLILNYLGSGTTPASCWASNVNGDGTLTSADGFHLLNYLGDPQGFRLTCGACEF
jgi:hypothetical protein